MSGVVHFKFKSSTAYDSVSFDGAFVSVGELKALIAEKKGLSKDATSELLLSDPRTQTDYKDDTAMVPKSSSVLVRRVPNLPAAHLQQQQQPQQPSSSGTPQSSKAIVVINQAAPAEDPVQGGEEEFGGELYSEQRDEDAALTQLLNQAGQNWEKEVKSTNPWGRGRGRGRDGPGRGPGGRGRGREADPIVLPKGYICYRCGQQGHHISDCPTNADPDFKRIRPAVGIPSVLLTKHKEGGLLLPDGTTGSLQPNEDAFLKETVGMPGAKAKPANGVAVSTTPSSSKEVETDNKAVVVYSEAGPALAGAGDLALPVEGPGLLLPPNTGMMPWDAPGLPPFLPAMGLSGDQPLSKEEFLRMKEGLRRKQDGSRHRSPSRSRSHSRSRSRSRHSERRRRGQDSRSPRRRDSPRRGYRHRRHRSRDRSHSRERRAYHAGRRRSPSPGFIQLRKRSRSPITRRLRSPPDVVQLRQRSSHSPPRRRARHVDLDRWEIEGMEGSAGPSGQGASPSRAQYLGFNDPQFGDSFDAKLDLRPTAPKHPMYHREVARAAAASNFRAPQLLDEAGPFFDEPTDQHMAPKGKQPAPAALEASNQKGSQRPLGAKRRKEGLQERSSPKVEESLKDTVAAQEQHDQGNAGENKVSVSTSQEPHPPISAEGYLKGEDLKPKSTLLPKTFSIAVEEDTRGRKSKKTKKDRDKDKSKSKKAHRKSSTPPPDQSQAAEAERVSGDGRREAAAAEIASPPEARDPTSKHDTKDELRSKGSHGPLFLRAMTDVSDSRKPTTRPTANESKASGDGKSKVSNSPEAPEATAPREAAVKVLSDEDEHKRKKEHKHKHKSKKRHKEKHSKQDK